MGKMQKRLDNHLARCHKGVTRAVNDNQPILHSPSSDLRVTCLLPGCGKQILHLSHHLKNMHSGMRVSEYHLEITIKEEIKERRSKQLQEEGKEMENEEVVKDRKLEKVENDENSQVKDHESVNAPDSDVSDGENNNPSCEQEEDDCEEVGGLTVEYSKPCNIESNPEQVEEITIQGLHVHGFSDENLRFLVHNTTPDGVRFFLSSLVRGGSIKTFSQSNICRVMLGEMDVSTLEEIYLHRKYLTSFYRLGRNYPYPDKAMIHRCIACGATERGKCVCPILPKSFYVFCRQECFSDWNCKKCINFDRGPSHACFDFFHCTRCHEQYVSSTKHQPYP